MKRLQQTCGLDGHHFVGSRSSRQQSKSLSQAAKFYTEYVVNLKHGRAVETWSSVTSPKDFCNSLNEFLSNTPCQFLAFEISHYIIYYNISHKLYVIPFFHGQSIFEQY